MTIGGARDPSTRHVVVLGPMGAGKTSIGRIVARELGRELADGDEILQREQDGRTAAEIATERGMDELHALEEEIALRSVASPTAQVIAPAASVCESAAVLEAVTRHHVVWLTAPVDYLVEKARRKRHRPLIEHDRLDEVVAAQLAVREPLVLALRPIVIDVQTTDDPDAAATIVDHVRRHP